MKTKLKSQNMTITFQFETNIETRKFLTVFEGFQTFGDREADFKFEIRPQMTSNSEFDLKPKYFVRRVSEVKLIILQRSREKCDIASICEFRFNKLMIVILIWSNLLEVIWGQILKLELNYSFHVFNLSFISLTSSSILSQVPWFGLSWASWGFESSAYLEADEPLLPACVIFETSLISRSITRGSEK